MKPLFTYFALAYAISWVVWLPLYAPALGWGSLPVVPFQHALGGLGPLTASVICTWWYGGRSAVNRLMKQMWQWQPLVYLLVALLSPFALEYMAALIARFKDGIYVSNMALLTSKEYPNTSLVLFFVYNLLFFGFGEEVGWRGFALPHMQRVMKPIPAVLLLTVLWAAWHWPLFLYRPGYISMDIAGAAGWLASLLTGSVLLSWMYNKSNGSILVCAIFHATVDIAFTAQVPQAMVNYMGMLITVWGVMTLFLLRSSVATGATAGRRQAATE